MTSTNPTSHPRGAGDGSPAARNLAEWFRQLDRFVRMARTFGEAAPNRDAARERVLEDFMDILGYHAPFVLHCTPLEYRKTRSLSRGASGAYRGSRG